ncbi:ATP-binding protein [Rhizobacter sp. LjRoot28]|uniref:ATP-binding protein n=1 Tax=Rhizobacter sp. LjRoot28 TaxID=3342309 RepID=UPI003ED099AC
MFHLQSLELLHWDYCQRLTLPLDGAIVTVAGPNGSGKTTLLDAMRTLLGLDCSGGRNYKTYARHANADSAWLRATVDNRPRTRQSGSRPFARCLLYSDTVTLACRIDRNGGDWQRRYLMVEGDVGIEALVARGDKDWLGIEHWRKRLEGAGLSRAIARVLALEQGQTDRLCEYSPKELLRLVFDVFGDQDVLDRYEEARSHQRQLSQEVEAAERELVHGKAQRAELEARVNLYQQYQLKLKERESLATEVFPVLTWAEERQQLTGRLRDLHRQRREAAGEARQRAELRTQLHALHEAQQAAAVRVDTLNDERAAAKRSLDAARDAERPLEELVKRVQELEALAAIETDVAQLGARLEALESRRQALAADWQRLSDQRVEAERALAGLQGQRQAPPPADVMRFKRTLAEAGIPHHVMADVVEITDERWRGAAEGVLRGARWVVVLQRAADESRALAIAERERYRHYVVAEAETAAANPPAQSLLAVMRFSAPVPGWLLRQLTHIQRVDSTEHGVRQGGEWITPQAYHRDGRGGRSVFVDPGDYQFGAAAVSARKTSIEQRLSQLDDRLTAVAQEQQGVQRQLKDAQQAAKGHKAAQELADRSGEFAEARQTLPALSRTRADAGARWQRLDADYNDAVREQVHTRTAYEQAQHRLQVGDQRAEQQHRDWSARLSELRTRTAASRQQRARFPARWIRPEQVAALRGRFGSATQARLRSEAVEAELAQGHWETDASVEEKLTLMNAAVLTQDEQLAQRKASNEAARIAVDNARARYIDVLKATVRRYRKNIIELGQLAGVVVSADLPHLDADDAVLRQAELKVNFNFDGKGEIGLNDGEASGGQQVIKSLILLVGLMKDDETPGGFVFIDEPFAHLDVRNIQLVGHFLKSTRAQYVLTTPITHNVEVFEPADITLVTAKKVKGERWAPPIGVLQRRAEPEVRR